MIQPINSNLKVLNSVALEYNGITLQALPQNTVKHFGKFPEEHGRWSLLLVNSVNFNKSLGRSSKRIFCGNFPNCSISLFS